MERFLRVLRLIITTCWFSNDKDGGWPLRAIASRLASNPAVVASRCWGSLEPGWPPTSGLGVRDDVDTGDSSAASEGEQVFPGLLSRALVTSATRLRGTKGRQHERFKDCRRPCTQGLQLEEWTGRTIISLGRGVRRQDGVVYRKQWVRPWGLTTLDGVRSQAWLERKSAGGRRRRA